MEMQDFLITILAKTDALFAPLRSHDWPGSAAICEARRRYPSDGLTFTSGGGSSGMRHAFADALNELAAAGLIVRLGDERRRAVKLTEKGDQFTRAVCCLPGISGTLDLIDRVRAFGGCAPETAVGEPTWPRGVTEVELYAAPALVRGWLTCRSTKDGAAHYQVTSLAPETAKDLPDLPVGVVKDYETYIRQYNQARAELRNATPDDQKEIGELRLPSCYGWTRLDRNWQQVVPIEDCGIDDTPAGKFFGMPAFPFERV